MRQTGVGNFTDLLKPNWNNLHISFRRCNEVTVWSVLAQPLRQQRVKCRSLLQLSRRPSCFWFRPVSWSLWLERVRGPPTMEGEGETQAWRRAWRRTRRERMVGKKGIRRARYGSPRWISVLWATGCQTWNQITFKQSIIEASTQNGLLFTSAPSSSTSAIWEGGRGKGKGRRICYIDQIRVWWLWSKCTELELCKVIDVVSSSKRGVVELCVRARVVCYIFLGKRAASCTGR